MDIYTGQPQIEKMIEEFKEVADSEIPVKDYLSTVFAMPETKKFIQDFNDLGDLTFK